MDDGALHDDFSEQNRSWDDFGTIISVAEPVEPSVPAEGITVSPSGLSLLGDEWFLKYVRKLWFMGA